MALTTERSLSIALIVILATLSGPVLAGRDAGQIEMQDKSKKAAAQQAADRALAVEMEAQRRYLPLDHGPHAAATPWSNQRTLALRKDTGRSNDVMALKPAE